ncbi:MAG: RHS repeat-associated core domain-containing protein [Opitutaceae bacterium]|nr:RHS repeat-associated core domain-containing protein [Opitutaceae bacterium]
MASAPFTDHETGLVFYGKRYYDPSNGRFVGRDSIQERGGLNLYGFCGNDGVNRLDH